MRLFLNVLFILLGVTCGHNVNAAATVAASPEMAGHFDAEGRRIARVRFIRNLELTAAEISAVVDGGRCLPGKSRPLSLSDVYHRLYTEYSTRSDSPENRISRLLNLTKLINDDNFGFPGRFFNSKASLYAYVCREAGIWIEKTDRRMFKSQLSLRTAHLHMGIWYETGEHHHLENAYNLFWQAYYITNNKYGLPMMAEIIMDHGFLAGHTTREKALIEADRLLSIFSEPRSTVPAVAPGERARSTRDAGRITSEKLRMGLSQGLAEELKARIAGAMATMDDEEEEEEEDNYGIMVPLAAPAASALAAQLPVPGGWGQAPAGLTSSSSFSPAAAMAEAAPVGWGHSHAGSTSSSSSSAAAAVAVAAAAVSAPSDVEEEEDDDDDAIYLGRRRFHVPSAQTDPASSRFSSFSAAATAAAPLSPSLEVLRAELRSRMARPRTDRRRITRTASSSAPRGPMAPAAHEGEEEGNPFPMRVDDGMGHDGTGSHIDRETKEIFGPDIQRIMRYKLIYPEKSNIVIASELGLPREAVSQVLS